VGVEAGDFMEIPISTSDLAYTVYGRYGRSRLGLFGLLGRGSRWHRDPVAVEPELRDGLLQWMPNHLPRRQIGLRPERL